MANYALGQLCTFLLVRRNVLFPPEQMVKFMQEISMLPRE